MKAELIALLEQAAGRIEAPVVRLRHFENIKAPSKEHQMNKPPEQQQPPSAAVQRTLQLPKVFEHHWEDLDVDSYVAIGFVWLLVNAVVDMVEPGADQLECERKVRELLRCNHSKAVAIVASAKQLHLHLGEKVVAPLPAALGEALIESVELMREDEYDYDGLWFDSYNDVCERLFDFVAWSMEESGEHNPDELQEEPLHPEYSKDAELAYHAELGDRESEFSDAMYEHRQKTKKWRLHEEKDEVPGMGTKEDYAEAAPGGRSDVFGPDSAEERKRKRTIHPIAFKTLALEIAQDYVIGVSFDCRAMAVLQDATERFMTEHMDEEFSCRTKVAAACAAHGGGCVCTMQKRKTTRPVRF
jgi:hypothetical protein